MTELCPECGRERAETVTEGQGRCKAHLDGLLAPSKCKDLTITRLRSELANALSIANSRTYCLDSPEVLKARVGELEKEILRLQGELAAARAIGELERAVVDAAVEWFSFANGSDHDSRIETERELAEEIDELVSARAATGEPKEE